MSRPMKSAPKMCAALGGASDSAESVVTGSKRVRKSAKIAANTKIAMMAAPTAPRGWGAMAKRGGRQMLSAGAAADAIVLVSSMVVMGSVQSAYLIRGSSTA